VVEHICKTKREKYCFLCYLGLELLRGKYMIYIVMCTFNGEKYIREQLQSIVDNTIENWNIIILDDQSDDNTVEIIKAYQKKYPDKIFFKVNQVKKGAIINFLNGIYEVGLHITKDDYIMLCDQDDVWNSDKIEKTMNGMNELVSAYGNHIPLLVCTDVSVVDDALNIVNGSFRRMNHYWVSKLDFPHLMMENKVQGCTTMLNKSMAEMLDKFPQRATMHDGWLALIASAFGEIKYIDEPTMKYRQHSNNVQGSIGYKNDVKNKLLNLGGQRKIVMDTTPQIKEFLEIYKDRLPEHIKRMATAFSSLPQQNFFVRRYNIIRYHMWKSGIIRNIGLMVLV
jgi:Glycosyltransferases involved in cell wall biogenesis